MIKLYSGTWIFFLLAFPVVASGQALKFTYIGYTAFENTPGKKNYFYGFGYEQNVGTNISISLDYQKGYSLDDNKYTEIFFTDQNSQGFHFSYYVLAAWKEFAYSSKYFFTGNNYRSWYISTGIAYRTVDYNLDISGLIYDNAYQTQALEIQRGVGKQSMTMVPFSLKFGRRGSIDDWFGDIYIGMNYIPGASGKSSGNVRLDNLIGEKYFSNLNFTIGIAFGFGWAD